MEELKERISNHYDRVWTHVYYPFSKKNSAEIDICAKRGEEIDIFEVKCSHRITKAKKQLQRARNYLGVPGNAYFYCGSSGLLVEVEEV